MAEVVFLGFYVRYDLAGASDSSGQWHAAPTNIRFEPICDRVSVNPKHPARWQAAGVVAPGFTILTLGGVRLERVFLAMSVLDHAPGKCVVNQVIREAEGVAVFVRPADPLDETAGNGADFGSTERKGG